MEGERVRSAGKARNEEPGRGKRGSVGGKSVADATVWEDVWVVRKNM